MADASEPDALLTASNRTSRADSMRATRMRSWKMVVLLRRRASCSDSMRAWECSTAWFRPECDADKDRRCTYVRKSP